MSQTISRIHSWTRGACSSVTTTYDWRLPLLRPCAVSAPILDGGTDSPFDVSAHWHSSPWSIGQVILDISSV